MNTCQGLLLVALVALSLQNGEALRCYVCNSDRDPSCKDKFLGSQHEHKLTYCSRQSMSTINDVLPNIFSNLGSNSGSYYQDDDFACVKAVTREHDREVVYRTCTIPRGDSFDVCQQLKSRNPAFCETCTKEACNGASPTTPILLLPALCAAAIALRYK